MHKYEFVCTQCSSTSIIVILQLILQFIKTHREHLALSGCYSHQTSISCSPTIPLWWTCKWQLHFPQCSTFAGNGPMRSARSAFILLFQLWSCYFRLRCLSGRRFSPALTMLECDAWTFLQFWIFQLELCLFNLI